MADSLPTLSGQMPTVNYVSKTKGCQKASLFSTDTIHPEIEFSQSKLLKMLHIPLGGKSKRKKAAEVLPCLPALSKPIWNAPGFTFPPFPLKSWEIVLPTDFNTHTDKHVFTWQSSSWLSKQKYMLTSRSKIIPKQRAYLKKPTVCLTFCPLASPSLSLNQCVV